MIYESFYDMNILMTDEAVNLFVGVGGFIVLSHLLLLTFLFYRFIFPNNKVYV